MSASIGELVDPQVGIIPAAQAAGTVNGPAIDRTGRRECVVVAHTGAIAGAPSSTTVAMKLQDSADGSTGWADLAGGAVPNITAANTKAELNYNLLAAKAFIRVSSVVSFTGGTSPNVQVAAIVGLGGGRVLPI